MKRSCLLECPVCRVKKRYDLINTLLTCCKHCQQELVIKRNEKYNTYSVGILER